MRRDTKGITEVAWHDKTDKQRAEEYEKLAEQTLPGYTRDTYLRYAKILRERAEK